MINISGLILGLVFLIFGILFICVAYNAYKRGYIHQSRQFKWMIAKRKEYPIRYWILTILAFILGIWLVVFALLFIF